MKEILEKIDEAKATIYQTDAWETKMAKDEFNRALLIAKEIIQDNQKEPSYAQLKYCCELQSDVIKGLEKTNGDYADRIVKLEGLMSEAVIKPLTIGDKIRVSNESLAEYIYKLIYNDFENKQDALDYLNQPYTEPIQSPTDADTHQN